jgi:hypothetical protein
MKQTSTFIATLFLLYVSIFTYNSVLAEGTMPLVVVTAKAYNITSNSVTFAGKFTSPGDSFVTDFGFEYGLTTAYGGVVKQNSYVNEPTVFGLSTSPNGSSITWAADLKCNTLYHYRAYATNSASRSYGDDMTFTTLKCDPGIVSDWEKYEPRSPQDIPSVETLPATDITETSVVFRGNLISMGSASSTNIGFDYNIPNNRARSLPLLPVYTVGPFSYPVVTDGLECNTKYNYHVEAVKPTPAANGTAIISTGSEMSFTTLPCTQVRKEVVKPDTSIKSNSVPTFQNNTQVQIKTDSEIVTTQNNNTSGVNGDIKSSVEIKTFKQKFFNLFKKLKFW